MKKYRYIVSVIMTFLLGNVLIAAENDFQSGLHYEWWKNSNADKGSQFYIPVQIDSGYNDFSCNLISAYAYTKVDPSESDAESLSAFTDTKLNLSYEIVDTFNFDVLCSLGFNLPTGHTDLKESEMTLLLPPELISISTFGEGFNLNPTIAIAKEWETWVAGIGLGYTWRGEYDYSYNNKKYDPGDILTLTGEAGHDFTADWYGKIFAQYVHYGKDTWVLTENSTESDQSYQEGILTLIGIGTSYKQPTWVLGFKLLHIFRGKSRFQPEGDSLSTENKKSLGDEWISDLSYRYFLNKETTLKSSLEFLWVDKNDYDSNQAYYTGKRQKTTLGCGIDRMWREDIKSSFDISWFIMDDGKNSYHPDESFSYRGLSISALITKKF